MESQNILCPTSEGQLEIELSGASQVINASKLDKSCLFCAEEPACWFSKQVNSSFASKEHSTSSRKLWGLISLSLFFMFVEIVGGVEANSLAVLTDAAHILIDIATYAVSLFSIWASSWPPTRRLSFGYFRSEVLGGLVSMVTIWLLCVFLIYEATERFLHNEGRIDGRLMFCTATFGFVINSIMAVWLGHGHDHVHEHEHEHEHEELHSVCHVKENVELVNEEKANLISSSLVGQQCEVKQAAQENMNIEGAYLHIIGDLIQSAGLMIGGAIIWAKPEWLIVDLICTLVFSFLVLWTTKRMLRNVLWILMEGTPDRIDADMLETGLRNVDGVRGIHDLHVSSLSMGKVLLTCHAIAEPDYSSKEILLKMKSYCEHKHKISHVTIQIEQDS
ncbi:metal tolerance protein A1-like [Aristolochia californica]|uniref:metal tolerance protein A1-like n=1 Tax=Aristolochia californica TaxID=171875 RepID=UPI0035DED2B1